MARRPRDNTPNGRRALWGVQALEAFGKLCGDYPDGLPSDLEPDDLRALASDLVSDVMHALVRFNLDPHNAVEIGTRNYDHEAR